MHMCYTMQFVKKNHQVHTRLIPSKIKILFKKLGGINFFPLVFLLWLPSLWLTSTRMHSQLFLIRYCKCMTACARHYFLMSNIATCCLRKRKKNVYVFFSCKKYESDVTVCFASNDELGTTFRKTISHSYTIRISQYTWQLLAFITLIALFDKAHFQQSLKCVS